METLTILVVGKQEDAREALMGTLSGIPGWYVLGADSVEAAIERLFAVSPDVVVLWGTHEEILEKKLKKISGLCQDPVFLAEGDPDRELVADQIREAVRRRKRERLGAIRVHDTLDAATLAKDIRLVP